MGAGVKAQESARREYFPATGARVKPDPAALAHEQEFGPRPRTRGECKDGERPCPWVSCKYHLMVDVNEQTGTMKTRYKDVEDMAETCALDVADRGGVTLEEIAQLVGLTRERIRQIQE